MQKQNDFPERPPSEREVNDFAREFLKVKTFFLDREWVRVRSVSRRVLDGPALVNDIAKNAAHAYLKHPQFRGFVRENGITAIHRHPFWPLWLNAVIADQWTEHYSTMPRMLTYSEINWLRLAACRDDGMLFPLVGDPVPYGERRLLNRLVKGKKLVPFFTTWGVGVWKDDPDHGLLTLRVTPKGEGGGDSDLKKLVARGYLEKIETRDPILRWQSEENVMYTLRLTEMGRDHIDRLVSGRLESVEEREEAGKETSDDAPSSEEQLDRNRVMRLSVEEKVAAAKACLGMPELKARAYIMYRSETGRNYTLEQVGDACGRTKSTIDRWIKDWDARFTDPEILLGLRRHIERNRMK